MVTERELQFLQLLPLLNGSLSQAGITVDNFNIGSGSETIFVSACTVEFLLTKVSPCIQWLHPCSLNNS